MRFAFESQDLENFPSLQVWSSDVSFMWASRSNHWTRVSYVKPRVWALTLWCFFLSSRYWPCVFLFAVRYSLSPLTKRDNFGYIDEDDPIVLFNLQKITPAFIRANKEWQARLTDNYSINQSSFSKMVSKRVRMICTMETISGFVRSGSPWSIIGLHPDNVGDNAPVWSQILFLPILRKWQQRAWCTWKSREREYYRYGLGFSLYQSFSRKWQQRQTHAHWNKIFH